jgi:hypothetical protein
VDAAGDFQASAKASSGWGALWREAQQDQKRSRREGREVAIRKVATHLADHHASEANPLCDIVGNRPADALAGVSLFLLMAWLSKLALGGWHESEVARES